MLENFHRKHDYLVCIDSDGCAMDTMNIKHFRAFGPQMIKVFGLEEWQDELLERWNRENLFSFTRGMNRFLGCFSLLSYVHETYREIPGLADMQDWIENATSLSNAGLKQRLAEAPSELLEKALEWSNAVNKAVGEIPEEENVPFPGVLETLQKIHEVADIAIVSSANPEAVHEEWTRTGLMPYVDVVCAQNVGTKAQSIGYLLEHGYDKAKVIKIGDAPGDQDAAEQNHVFYYPILAGDEAACWKAFDEVYFDRFMAGTYGEVQEEMQKRFNDNLSRHSDS